MFEFRWYLCEDDPAPAPGVPAVDPEPEPESEPTPEPPVSRQELDELRRQTASAVKRLNRAIKKNRAANVPPLPAPVPEPAPEPAPQGKPGFLGGIIGPMKRRRP